MVKFNVFLIYSSEFELSLFIWHVAKPSIESIFWNYVRRENLNGPIKIFAILALVGKLWNFDEENRNIQHFGHIYWEKYNFLDSFVIFFGCYAIFATLFPPSNFIYTNRSIIRRSNRWKAPNMLHSLLYQLNWLSINYYVHLKLKMRT